MEPWGWCYACSEPRPGCVELVLREPYPDVVVSLCAGCIGRTFGIHLIDVGATSNCGSRLPHQPHIWGHPGRWQCPGREEGEW